ncbi:MAG: hypothetical protein WCG48_00540 [Candidatus Berkelbacteria bacterium]
MPRWSSKIAYAVGLMVTDGNLSRDGRHLDLTSKDIEQLENFNKCLSADHKITWKVGGCGRMYPRIQFSDVALYRWMLTIGLTPNKSKTIGIIKVPDKYFLHFLRGCFDGDGSSYSYWDKRWKSSYMIYTQFISASRTHLEWIRDTIEDLLHVRGKIKKSGSVFQLTFAKKASFVIYQNMYKNARIFLTRKKDKFEKAIIAGMEKLVNSQP